MRDDASLLHDAGTVAAFAQLAKRFAGIEGWLSPADGYLLYRLARDGEGAGAIVEIGSWMGLSTAWLASGSREAGREPVHAVDVFDGGRMLREEAVIRREGTTYHRFVENMEALGLFDHIAPVVADSARAARDWRGGAIRLLFVDGDHGYEAVRRDCDLWTPQLAVGGYLVLDDAIDHYPGVLQVCREISAEPGRWQHVCRTYHTETFRKLA